MTQKEGNDSWMVRLPIDQASSAEKLSVANSKNLLGSGKVTDCRLQGRIQQLTQCSYRNYHMHEGSHNGLEGCDWSVFCIAWRAVQLEWAFAGFKSTFFSGGWVSTSNHWIANMLIDAIGGQPCYSYTITLYGVGLNTRCRDDGVVTYRTSSLVGVCPW